MNINFSQENTRLHKFANCNFEDFASIHALLYAPYSDKIVYKSGTVHGSSFTNDGETDASQTDASQTDASQTDASQTDAPQTDAPQTDAPHMNG